jgi:hypothetical protein
VQTLSGVPFPVIVAGMTVLIAGSWYLVPRWWRPGASRASAAVDHINRAFLANVLTLTSLTLGTYVIQALVSGWISAEVARIAFLPVIAIGGLSAAAIATTFLFNRPKFIVPPHLRTQPGRLSKPWPEAESVLSRVRGRPFG